MKAKIVIACDAFNHKKQWLVKRTIHGHYYLAQLIHGMRMHNYQRTTLNHVGETLSLDNNMVQGFFK